MPQEQEEGLTTDLDSTVDDVQEDIETDSDDLLETQDEPQQEEDNVPDIIDTGVEGDDDTEVPSTVDDVVQLIQGGDTEAAIKRLAEYGRGVEKLQARAENARIATLSEVSEFYADLGKGSEEALEHLESQILSKVGTSLADLYARSIGLDKSELETLLEGGSIPSKAPADSKEVLELKARLERVEQGNATKEWVANYGSAIQSAVEKATGLTFPVDVLAQARYELKPKATVADIVKAVMKVNPDAYIEADKAKKTRPDAPVTAMVQKGGKGGGKFDPAEMLKNRSAWLASQG